MTDHDLQALLSGDAADLDARLGAETRTSLDAYREVYAALETPTGSFTVGFADRVMTRVARRAPRRARFPTTLAWATVATALGWLALRTEALAHLLGDAFGASAPDAFAVGAAPVVVLALALLTVSETVDQTLRRDAHPS